MENNETKQNETTMMTFEECFTKCQKLIDALQVAQQDLIKVTLAVEQNKMKQDGLYDKIYVEVSNEVDETTGKKRTIEVNRRLTNQKLIEDSEYINVSVDLKMGETTIKELQNTKILIEHKIALYKRLLDHYNSGNKELIDAVLAARDQLYHARPS